jgi:hypothetical protein
MDQDIRYIDLYSTVQYNTITIRTTCGIIVKYSSFIAKNQITINININDHKKYGIINILQSGNFCNEHYLFPA